MLLGLRTWGACLRRSLKPPQAQTHTVQWPIDTAGGNVAERRDILASTYFSPTLDPPVWGSEAHDLSQIELREEAEIRLVVFWLTHCLKGFGTYMFRNAGDIIAQNVPAPRPGAFHSAKPHGHHFSPERK